MKRRVFVSATAAAALFSQVADAHTLAKAAK
jgi:hypothetical protein